MSYTPTTWANGDTITASAMNKIENGIAGAGGGGTACIRLSASNVGSGTKTFGYFTYASKIDNTWVLCSDTETDVGWTEIYGYSGPSVNVVCLPLPYISLPGDIDVGLFLIDGINIDKSVSGDISSTSDTLYHSFGSPYPLPAYRITGNCSFRFIGSA